MVSLPVQAIKHYLRGWRARQIEDDGKLVTVCEIVLCYASGKLVLLQKCICWALDYTFIIKPKRN